MAALGANALSVRSAMLVPIERPEAAFSKSLLGGKGFNLAKIAKEFPSAVPKAVVVPTVVYKEHVASIADLKDDFKQLDKGLSISDVLERIRSKILKQPIGENISREVSSFLESLPPSTAVSVRSSATAEDGSDASYAGIFDTYLNQRGVDRVCDAIKRCWASSWSDSVFAYARGSFKEGLTRPIMAVVIQAQINSQAAGVMFTLNVRNGALTEYTVESVWGQGEGLVSGALVPDKFIIRASDNFLLQSETSVKQHYFGLKEVSDAGKEIQSWEKRRLSHDKMRQPSLSKEQLEVLGIYGTRLKSIYSGQPQDVEFSVDGHGKVFLLQSRPVTSIKPDANAVEAQPFSLPDRWKNKRRYTYTWKLNEHFVRPHTLLWRSLYIPAIDRGLNEAFFAYMGITSPMMEVSINGFVYQADSLGNSSLSQGYLSSTLKEYVAPFAPLCLLRGVTRTMFYVVSDAIKMRKHTAVVMQSKLWLRELELWDNTIRPDLIRRHKKLTSVNVDKMTVSELFEHIDKAIEHFTFCAYNHHRWNFAAMIPASLFLLYSQKHGVSEIDSLELLEGVLRSQVHKHGPGQLLRKAFKGDDTDALPLLEKAASDAVDDDGASAILQELRLRPGLVGKSMNLYLEENEFRQIGGYDIAFKSGWEMPKLLASAAFHLIVEDLSNAKHLHQVDRAFSSVRPSSAAKTWLTLMKEAHACHRLRDERSLYSDIWAAGILRYFLLALGRREPFVNVLRHPEHILFVSKEELGALRHEAIDLQALSLLLESRFKYATQTPISAAPEYINGPPVEDSSGDLVSYIGDTNVRRLFQALLHVSHQTAGVMSQHKEANVKGSLQLKGDSGAKGCHEGKVKLVKSPSDFSSVQVGDVVVAEFTNSSFTLLVSKAGAVVTEVGGTLSHAAIVCRESNVPCVTNCTNATSLLVDGEVVVVDGTAGTVRRRNAQSFL